MIIRAFGKPGSKTVKLALGFAQKLSVDYSAYSFNSHTAIYFPATGEHSHRPYPEEEDKLVMLYPITYRTMCGSAKLWLESFGAYLKSKKVMAIGVGGSTRGTHTFELDFIAVMSGIGADWSRKNVLVVPGNKDDEKRALHRLMEYMEEK